MNNIKLKNVIQTFNADSGLPYPEFGAVNHGHLCTTLNAADVNNSLNQLVENDLYIQAYLNTRESNTAGPKTDTYDGIAAQPDGYKYYDDFNNSDYLPIMRKRVRPTADSWSKSAHFTGRIIFLLKHGDYVLVGLSTGMSYLNDIDSDDWGDISGLNSCTCGYVDGDWIFVGTASGIYKIERVVNPDRVLETDPVYIYQATYVYSSLDLASVNGIAFDKKTSYLYALANNTIYRVKYKSSSSSKPLVFEEVMLEYLDGTPMPSDITVNGIDASGGHVIVLTNHGLFRNQTITSIAGIYQKNVGSSINGMVYSNGKFYMATEGGLYAGTTILNIAKLGSYSSVKTVVKGADGIYFSSGSNIYQYSLGEFKLVNSRFFNTTISQPITAMAFDESGKYLFVGYGSKCVYFKVDEEKIFICTLAADMGASVQSIIVSKNAVAVATASKVKFFGGIGDEIHSSASELDDIDISMIDSIEKYIDPVAESYVAVLEYDDAALYVSSNHVYSISDAAQKIFINKTITAAAIIDYNHEKTLALGYNGHIHLYDTGDFSEKCDFATELAGSVTFITQTNGNIIYGDAVGNVKYKDKNYLYDSPSTIGEIGYTAGYNISDYAFLVGSTLSNEYFDQQYSTDIATSITASKIVQFDGNSLYAAIYEGKLSVYSRINSLPPIYDEDNPDRQWQPWLTLEVDNTYGYGSITDIEFTSSCYDFASSEGDSADDSTETDTAETDSNLAYVMSIVNGSSVYQKFFRISDIETTTTGDQLYNIMLSGASETDFSGYTITDVFSDTGKIYICTNNGLSVQNLLENNEFGEFEQLDVVTPDDNTVIPKMGAAKNDELIILDTAGSLYIGIYYEDNSTKYISLTKLSQSIFQNISNFRLVNNNDSLKLIVWTGSRIDEYNIDDIFDIKNLTGYSLEYNLADNNIAYPLYFTGLFDDEDNLDYISTSGTMKRISFSTRLARRDPTGNRADNNIIFTSGETICRYISGDQKVYIGDIQDSENGSNQRNVTITVNKCAYGGILYVYNGSQWLYRDNGPTWTFHTFAFGGDIDTAFSYDGSNYVVIAGSVYKVNAYQAYSLNCDSSAVEESFTQVESLAKNSSGSKIYVVDNAGNQINVWCYDTTSNTGNSIDISDADGNGLTLSQLFVINGIYDQGSIGIGNSSTYFGQCGALSEWNGVDVSYFSDITDGIYGINSTYYLICGNTVKAFAGYESTEQFVVNTESTDDNCRRSKLISDSVFLIITAHESTDGQQLSKYDGSDDEYYVITYNSNTVSFCPYVNTDTQVVTALSCGSIMQTKNLKLWHYLFTPNGYDFTYPTDMVMINDYTYIVGYTDGLYYSKYIYDAVDDISAFTQSDAVMLYDQLMQKSNGISSIQASAMTSHVQSYHASGSFMQSLNSEYIGTDMSGVTGWQVQNNTFDDLEITNDIVDEIDFGDQTSMDIQVAVENFLYSGDVDYTYITKRWKSGITEIYINVPTTKTYYLADTYGVPHVTRPATVSFERPNLADFTGVGAVTGTVSDHYTTIFVRASKSVFGMSNIMGMHITGNSLPLGIYKSSTALGADQYASFVEPSVFKYQTDTDDEYYTFAFACFGTDAQAIKIMFYDAAYASGQADYVKVRFNPNGGTGKKVYMQKFVFSDGVITGRNLAACAFTAPSSDKQFMGWTLYPQSDGYTGGSDYDGTQVYANRQPWPHGSTAASQMAELGYTAQNPLTAGEIIDLYAVWNTVDFSGGSTIAFRSTSAGTANINKVTVADGETATIGVETV